MKKGKTISEYCSNCDEELEMPIVQRDPSNPHLIWVRCPKCHETKPVDIAQVADELHEEPEAEGDEFEEEMEDTLEEVEEEVEEEELEEIIPEPELEKKPSKKPPKKKPGKEKTAEPELEFKILPEKAREYHPWDNYQPGETIKHLQWKDYGVVLRVRRTGGGRTMIEVRFEKSGEKKLVINQKPSSS